MIPQNPPEILLLPDVHIVAEEILIIEDFHSGLGTYLVGDTIILFVEQRITREELLSELDRLKQELGEVPTSSDMTNHGAFGANTYSRRFGSWNDALVAAGFVPHHEHNVSKDNLLKAINNLRETLNRTPTSDDMDKKGGIQKQSTQNDSVRGTTPLKRPD